MNEIQEQLDQATKKSMIEFIGMPKHQHETRTCYRCKRRHPIKDVFVSKYMDYGKKVARYLCYGCAMIGRDIVIGRGGER